MIRASLRRWLGALVPATLLAVLIAAAGPLRAEPVRLGVIDVSFYQVTGGVVHEVLERLGHEVAVTQAKHREMFPMLGAGEVDLLVAAWLPHAHGDYWEAHGPQAMELATLYTGARLYWAVPAYVPADAVSAIPDLAKPEVAGRMIQTLQGIGRGAGSSKRGVRAIAAYGLGELGYTYRFGGWRDRYEALDAAWQAREWIVVPMGAPMFLNAAYDLRPLEDPQGILGGANRGVLVAHRGFPDRVPKRTVTVLGRIELGLEAVSWLDDQVVRHGKTPREAARAWMAAHPDAVAAWFRDP